MLKLTKLGKPRMLQQYSFNFCSKLSNIWKLCNFKDRFRSTTCIARNKFQYAYDIEWKYAHYIIKSTLFSLSWWMVVNCICVILIICISNDTSILHSLLWTPMQGNGYIIIYTELMITAILQDFVPLGKIVNLKK